MANTLLQYWLSNYFCFKLEQFSSSSQPQQSVCDNYKDEIKALSATSYRNDAYFLSAIYSKLQEMVCKESDFSIENNRGNDLCELLKHLKWLVSPSVPHKYLARDMGVLSIFTHLNILDTDITEFLKPNAEIELSDLSKYEVIITKRNIAEYIIDKLFYSKYQPESYELTKDLKVESERLLKSNINILLGFGHGLRPELIKDPAALESWHRQLSADIHNCVFSLIKAREDIFLTWAYDAACSRVYRALGREVSAPRTACMESLLWVVENVLSLNSGETPKERYNLRTIMTKCFTELKLRPEITTLAGVVPIVVSTMVAACPSLPVNEYRQSDESAQSDYEFTVIRVPGSRSPVTALRTSVIERSGSSDRFSQKVGDDSDASAIESDAGSDAKSEHDLVVEQLTERKGTTAMVR